MPVPTLEDLTDRLRDSRFGREVVGPKIARPVGTWLHTTFPDADGTTPAEAAEAPEPLEHAPVAAAVAEAPVAEAPVAVGSATEASGRMARIKAGALAVKDGIKNHNLVVVAAGIAFWGLLAIPAVLFATVSITGLVVDPVTVKDEVNNNLDGLPEEARKIIGTQLASVSGGSTGGLITGVVVSIALALWTSSGAMAKMMSTLNTIYGTLEQRKFVKLRGTALALTFGGIVFIAAAVAVLAVIPAVLSTLGEAGEQAARLVNYLRFPALGLVMVIGLGVLYHLGPDRRAKYRPITVGAIVATVLWVVLTALFSVYTATVASYNETYGTLGGLVILLLWLFITAFVVLIGAEIHAHTASDESGRSD